MKGAETFVIQLVFAVPAVPFVLTGICIIGPVELGPIEVYMNPL